MEEGTDVASVPLKHDSLEFKMVASEFKRTLGGYTLQQIHEVCIWRIILGKCLLISRLPGKALRTHVDITRLAERFNLHSQSQAW